MITQHPLDNFLRLTNQTPFMKFWEALNAVMTDHKLPEVLYGEARDMWAKGYSFGERRA